MGANNSFGRSAALRLRKLAAELAGGTASATAPIALLLVCQACDLPRGAATGPGAPGPCRCGRYAILPPAGFRCSLESRGDLAVGTAGTHPPSPNSSPRARSQLGPAPPGRTRSCGGSSAKSTLEPTRSPGLIATATAGSTLAVTGCFVTNPGRLEVARRFPASCSLAEPTAWCASASRRPTTRWPTGRYRDCFRP